MRPTHGCIDGGLFFMRKRQSEFGDDDEESGSQISK